ncbi:MAG: type II secretion system protein [Candidatus Vogelbacteria bacterium]|nr:type II secretion system protein [Candidatus Vogelbacteria bacterium]
MLLSIKHKVPSTSSGFTLIELLVTISIFLIVTVVTLANFPQFSNKLSLDLLAEDIALSIKQAQVFGSSVFGTTGDVSSGKIFKAYGVHFPAPLPIIASQPIPNYNYILYADLSTPPNNQYDGLGPFDTALKCSSGMTGSGSECLDKYIVNGINKVLAVCANYQDLNKTYSLVDPRGKRISDCISNPVKSLDVTFIRPSLEAKFVIKDSGNNILPNTSNVGIVLGIPSSAGSSPRGPHQKAVIIWKTGLISIE